MQQFREQLVLSIGTKLAVFVYHSQVLSGAGHRQKLRKSIGILETFGGKAMWQRNNGQAEDDLQFRFTAYLVSAVKRRRKDYLIQLYKRSSIESTVEVVYESEPSSEEVVLDRLPLMDVIENGALLEALQKLNERERQIFLGRYKLRELLHDAGLSLSDQQIKNRINLLKKAQLILSSNGQGSMITDKGVEYLQTNRPI